MKNKNAFTLIEIILVLAIIAIITAIFTPVYNHFYVKNNLDIATYDVVSSLNRAQVLAKGSKHDSAWGVYVNIDEATVFKGDDYLSRDVQYDEIIPFKGISSVAGNNEVIFQKNTGHITSSTKIIIYSNSQDFENVYINELGTISY